VSPSRLTPAADAPGRVLVVDDTDTNRDLLARRLRSLGYEVTLAANGVEAIERLVEATFDLVLLDVMMPEMDGFAVLERLRADPVLSRVPVVMISAVDEVASVARCIELGAVDYLPKPFNPVVLKARVSATLARKRLDDRERLHAHSLERELEIGREIQRDFLPGSLPRLPGWDLASTFQPARQVGGDFYDVFPTADGALAVVIADVCDKGVGAALYMAIFRTLLRSHAELHGSIALAAPAARSVVALTNDYIAHTHGASNMFATVFFALLDPATGSMAWVNGGHEPPMLRRRSGVVERLAPTGPAVGMLPDAVFRAETGSLQPGDLLLLFTDGVTEERDAAEGFFGEARLTELVSETPESAQDLLGRIEASVRAFRDETEPLDDVTLVALRRV